MTWGLKQTCLLDIHDNTFEGAPLEPFPIWSQYSTYRYSCGHLRTHCLELFGKKRCGQDWLESKTGWNPGLDRVQIEQNIYGSFNSLPVMPATSHLHTQQIPATCCACCQLDCNQHPKIVADQTVQYSFMYWFLRLAHHSHSFVD